MYCPLSKIIFFIMQLTSLNIFINKVDSSPIYIFIQTTHGKFPDPIIWNIKLLHFISLVKML